MILLIVIALNLIYNCIKIFFNKLNNFLESQFTPFWVVYLYFNYDATIDKSVNDEDQIFQIARALGPKYVDFKTAILTKPPYPSLKQFIYAF